MGILDEKYKLISRFLTNASVLCTFLYGVKGLEDTSPEAGVRSFAVTALVFCTVSVLEWRVFVSGAHAGERLPLAVDRGEDEEQLPQARPNLNALAVKKFAYSLMSPLILLGCSALYDYKVASPFEKLLQEKGWSAGDVGNTVLTTKVVLELSVWTAWCSIKHSVGCLNALVQSTKLPGAWGWPAMQTEFCMAWGINTIFCAGLFVLVNEDGRTDAEAMMFACTTTFWLFETLGGSEKIRQFWESKPTCATLSAASSCP